MDFDQIVTNEEIYDPDSQVVRSQATVTDNSTTDNVEQPVSVAQNIPNGDMVAAGTGSVSRKSRTEETVNYEISKVVRNKVKTAARLNVWALPLSLTAFMNEMRKARLFTVTARRKKWSRFVRWSSRRSVLTLNAAIWSKLPI